MTPEEENKLLNGPFPWRGPGFIVTRYGLMPDLPPSINWKEKAWSDRRDERRERVQEVRESVYEEISDLSRSDLQATIEMTRDELVLQWERLKREGEEVVEQFEQLRDWIAERIQDAYREEPKGAKWPHSDRLEKRRPWNEVMRTGRTGGSWGTQHFRVMLRKPNPTVFATVLRSAHTLLLRYKTLQQKRVFTALGSSRSNEYESPSPSARKALSAVARLDRENDGLAETEIGDVWGYLEEEMGLVNARANVRQDMRGRNKAPGRYPEDTEELLELAREVANDRGVPFEVIAEELELE